MCEGRLELRAEQIFSSERSKRMFVLEVGGLLAKARAESTCSTSEIDVMNTLIRVVKRGSEENKGDSEAAPPAKPRLTTEMIVKSWIIESREQRRAAMSQFQSLLGWKELGGLARG
jgi:hypothetical protein